MKWDVINDEGKAVDSIELDDDIFTGKINKAVISESVKIYMGNKRQGSADTKERSEIAKSTAKPWRQKGTGRARAGMASSPIWRGGGVIFGPTPRSYRRGQPRKVKRLACKSALCLKVQEKALFVLDKISIVEPDTKAAKILIKNIQAAPKALFVIKEKNDNLYKSVRNIKKTIFKKSSNINAYDILSADSIVFTKDSIEDLAARLKKPIARGRGN